MIYNVCFSEDNIGKEDDIVYVFVYGSLMKGYWNHNFLSNEKYIAEGILKNYGLYSVSSFPGVIRKEGATTIGEVYDVSEKTLEKLDLLEGEGSMYLRRAINVDIKKEITEAYIYLWNGPVREKDYIQVENLPWKPTNIKEGAG